jgi:hypothetical protein
MVIVFYGEQQYGRYKSWHSMRNGSGRLPEGVYNSAYVYDPTPEPFNPVPGSFQRIGSKWYRAEFNKQYLGIFSSPEEAHAAYVAAKNTALTELAAQQSDSRIRDALLTKLE